MELGIASVAAITAIAYLLGMAVKATSVADKWIPIICGVAGLILGDFDLAGTDSLAGLRLREAVWARVLELVGPGFPVWADFPAGHRTANLALPMGMEAVMDEGVLRFLPGSVTLA